MDTSTNDILFQNNVYRSEQPIPQKHEGAAADDMCRLIKRLELILQVVVTDKGSHAQAVIKKYFPDCIIQVATVIDNNYVELIWLTFSGIIGTH